jgi:hypothetical protein
MGGEEYKSFPYLMHAVEVKGGRVNYATGPKPLEFDEMYSPRDGLQVIGKCSKSFWRTRENFDFQIYEARKEKLIIICCIEMNSKVTFKTIVCSLEPIYQTLNDKKRESEETIVRKNQMGYQDDQTLFLAVVSFLEQRLNIVQEEVAWPAYIAPTEAQAQTQAEAEAVNATTADAAGQSGKAIDMKKEKAGDAAVIPADAEAVKTAAEGPMERMVVLSKLAADQNSFEVPVELLGLMKVDISSIPPEHLKLVSTAAAAAEAAAAAAEAEAATTAPPEAEAVEPAGATAANTAAATTKTAAPVTAPAPNGSKQKPPLAAAAGTKKPAAAAAPAAGTKVKPQPQPKLQKGKSTAKVAPT